MNSYVPPQQYPQTNNLSYHQPVSSQYGQQQQQQQTIPYSTTSSSSYASGYGNATGSAVSYDVTADYSQQAMLMQPTANVQSVDCYGYPKAGQYFS